MKRKAIVIGATGLVGKKLVSQLNIMYDSLIIVARKPPKHMSAQMQFYQLGDFNNLEETLANISIGPDTDAFSCLGTTKKQAGSDEAFKQVDYDYNLNFAKFCHDKGVQRFFILSALGADTKSRFFYNRVKGELEKALAEIGFNELVIFQPSLLLGKHKGRVLENTAQSAFKLISPLVPKTMRTRPIEAERVAAVMAMMAQNIYERHKVSGIEDIRNKVTVIDNKQMLAMTQLKS
ncbi:NAD(P)H-binding protein [Psychrobacter phenylpyruvicus]|uniref:HIM1 n=1 Tax=Psychrobacter phenylpyruvicus TaxID=29432 RepID=A0A379LKY1_9GAMM|nr:NAD(P)H-binding protein [Psychrobacter phenylpyruvicus]SUD90422.1 HIM1 [Psychrobacter phenylpyruvicus]